MFGLFRKKTPAAKEPSALMRALWIYWRENNPTWLLCWPMLLASAALLPLAWAFQTPGGSGGSLLALLAFALAWWRTNQKIQHMQDAYAVSAQAFAERATKEFHAFDSFFLERRALIKTGMVADWDKYKYHGTEVGALCVEARSRENNTIFIQLMHGISLHIQDDNVSWDISVDEKLHEWVFSNTPHPKEYGDAGFQSVFNQIRDHLPMLAKEIDYAAARMAKKAKPAKKKTPPPVQAATSGESQPFVLPSLSAMPDFALALQDMTAACNRLEKADVPGDFTPSLTTIKDEAKLLSLLAQQNVLQGAGLEMVQDHLVPRLTKTLRALSAVADQHDLALPLLPALAGMAAHFARLGAALRQDHVAAAKADAEAALAVVEALTPPPVQAPGPAVRALMPMPAA